MKKVVFYVAGCTIGICSLFLSMFLITFLSGDPFDYNFGISSWLIAILMGLAFGHFYSIDRTSRS